MNSTRHESDMEPCPCETANRIRLPEEDILDEMKRVLIERREMYNENTIGLIPLRHWKSQILIKALRADNTPSHDVNKLKDELLDTANYCILVLAELESRGGSW